MVGGNGEQNLKISYHIVNFVIVVNANWNVGYKLHHEGILLKFEVARWREHISGTTGHVYVSSWS